MVQYKKEVFLITWKIDFESYFNSEQTTGHACKFLFYMIDINFRFRGC